MGAVEFPIKDFAGLNLLSAGDKVADNEFTLLQNVYQPSRGVFQRRFGSVIDKPPSSFPMCSRISGVWRHYAPGGNRFSLYHCVPDNTLLPDNTTDLLLHQNTSATGNIFGGSGPGVLRVCYSWIGRGMEQTYNSKSRAGFPSVGSFPLNASSNPGHQAITMTSGTNTLTVTIPAFPTGVVGANIFVARTTVTEMVYMGTILTSGGNITISEFIGPFAASADPLTFAATPIPLQRSTGTLAPGSYWVAASWVYNHGIEEGASNIVAIPVLAPTQVTVSGNQNSIEVFAPSGNSANGAQAIYVFIGTQSPAIQPMTCVGVVRVGNAIQIDSIPSHNAQTCPVMGQPDTAPGVFWNQVNDQYIGGFNLGIGQRLQARFGFLMAKNQAGALNEVFPSRSLIPEMFAWNGTVIYAGDSITTTSDIHNFATNPRTQNDIYNSPTTNAGWVQPYAWAYSASDPMFCYLLGLSYFANSVDIPWCTDGYTLGQLAPVKSTTQTLLPPIPKFLFTYQNCLVASGAQAQNQVYSSNANAPQNWATGGTGALLRYVSPGDAVGSGITASGAFTPQTEATSDPGSFLIAFKKIGTWMVNTIPDPTSSSIVTGNYQLQVPTVMVQVSGRVGCVAYRSIAQTPFGTLFMGQDANIYLINQIAEPIRVGTKVQNALIHLVGHDSWMQLVTAVFHDNHYKISYPSPAAVLLNPAVNDSELWLDTRTDQGPMQWMGPHLGRNIGPQIVLAGDQDDLSRLVADGSIVRTYTADSTASLTDLNSSGAAQSVTSIIQSKIYRFGKEAHVKRYLGALLDMYLDYSYTNNVLFQAWADEYYQQVNRNISNGGGVWDSSQWDATTFADALYQGFSFLFGNTNLIGRTFQWSVTKSDNAPFILSSATLQMKAEKRSVIL